VSVAAAIAINIHRSVSKAYIVGMPRLLASTGAFALTSASDTDGSATASGAAVTASGGTAAIGVGVATQLRAHDEHGDRPVGHHRLGERRDRQRDDALGPRARRVGD